MNDIPGYSLKKHEDFVCTIAGGLDPSLKIIRWVACHYSKTGEQLQGGCTTNSALETTVIHARLSPPKVDGDPHALFEDTHPPRP